MLHFPSHKKFLEEKYPFENFSMCNFLNFFVEVAIQLQYCFIGATVNQHMSMHHTLDACYYSVVDEPQLS
jgi:hypothetical protein